MDFALDPSEMPGTPEYEEIFIQERDRLQHLLDQIAEDEAYEAQQYPYRPSN